MNVADSETMAGVLERAGMALVDRAEDADAVIINTCAIREHAEQRVLGRLGEFARLKAARPDLLVISGYYGDSKIIAETAAKLRIGVHALVGLANAAYSNPRFITENRELTDHLFDGNYWHNPQSPRARAVFEAYQKRFNSVMSNHGVQGYQVAFVLKDALERAASTDREKVRDAISKTNLTDHILTQDAIKFDEAGENVNATPALLQVQGGKPVVVGPARFVEAKPVFPVPKWKG